MKCRIIQTQLIEYLRNELDEATRSMITAHLDSCTACREDYDTAKMILSFSSAKQPTAPPESYWISLLPRIRMRIDTPAVFMSTGVLQRYLVPLAAAIVIIIMALRIGNVEPISNLEDAQFILQQVPETELQEYLQKQYLVGINETKQPKLDSILTEDDEVVVSDLIARESSAAGYVDDDPVMMYQTISNRTANEIVSIIASKNL